MLNILPISWEYIIHCTLIWIRLLLYGIYQGVVLSAILIMGDNSTVNVHLLIWSV